MTREISMMQAYSLTLKCSILQKFGSSQEKEYKRGCHP